MSGFLNNFLLHFEVQPINNVLIVSDAQQCDASIDIHVPILPQTPLSSRLPRKLDHLSDLLHLAQYPPSPSMLVQIVKIPSFLCLSSISLCVCRCLCRYIYRVFFICSFVDGHLVYFHILLIVNAAVNIEVNVSSLLNVFLIKLKSVCTANYQQSKKTAY